MKSFKHLLNQNVITGVQKQLNLQSIIGYAYQWELDLDQAKLIILNTNKNKKLTFKIEVLGSESSKNKSWMWSWANPELKYQDELLTTANSLYNLGVEESIKELTSPVIITGTNLFSYEIGCLAVSLFDLYGFFKATHQKGSLLLVISTSLPNLINLDSPGLINIIQKACKYFNFDIYQGIKTFLESHGYTINQIADNKYIACKNSQSDIIFHISNNKLYSINISENNEATL